MVRERGWSGKTLHATSIKALTKSNLIHRVKPLLEKAVIKTERTSNADYRIIKGQLTSGIVYIYIHVPFCNSRCIYCDFYVTLAKYGGQQAFTDNICKEFTLRLAQQPAAAGQQVQAVYFGGGTPSLLTAIQIDTILQTLNQQVPFSPKVEITLEANPNAWADPPTYYRKVGVNRLSLGVQTMVDSELQRLSRNHRSGDVLNCLEDVYAAGFRNVSIDLMYGIPTQTLESWQQTLTGVSAMAKQLQHISFYGLHVEEATPLHHLQQFTGVYPLPSEDDTVSMYQQGCQHFESLGFELYEFSNMARPGKTSQHNLNYWHNGEYLALGPGAHGYWHGQRYENCRDLSAYLADPLTLQTDPHTPDEQEQWETAMMVGLRLSAGLDMDELSARYGVDVEATCKPVWDKYRQFFWFKGNRFGLTREAIPVSNTLLAEFLTSV
jgi:oxygen-independent coproporphyrinogen III oxidase